MPARQPGSTTDPRIAQTLKQRFGLKRLRHGQGEVIERVLGGASTDANVPMNLGIPAIAIGAGGDGGGAHAPSEWIDVAEDASVRGAAAAMATVLGAANALP